MKNVATPRNIPPVMSPARQWTSTRSEYRGFLFWCFALLGLFNFALPKAGIKIGALPFTWGYATLGLLGILAICVAPLAKGPRLMPVVQCCLGFFPLGVMAIIKGANLDGAMTSTIVWTINFIVLPAIILLFFSRKLEKLSDQQISVVLVTCLRFAIMWGLFNFLLYALTKSIVEISYVTVNAADYGETFSKNNKRGTLMKLVSTYNNGNIFGACALMLAPLYFVFEKSRRWRILYIIAVILTLSRTAWFGLAAMFLIMGAFGLIKLNKASVWLLIASVMLAILSMLPLMGWGTDKLADYSLGNRIDTLDRFNWSLLGADRIKIPELTYVGLANSFGVIGLIFGFIALVFPLVHAASRFRQLDSVAKSAAAGSATYLTLAAVDGALAFPPILAFYLFVSAMIYRRRVGAR